MLAPLLAGGLFALGVVAWPFVAGAVVERFGVRALGLWLLGVGALSSLVLRRRGRASLGLDLGAAPGLGIAVLAALAIASEDRLPLRLVTSWAYGVAALLFWRSLAGGESLIEWGAKFMHPYAPDFIRPYCRKVTRAWAGFLLANGLVFAALALWAPAAWESYARWGVYGVMLALGGVEFVVRKAWFRYYPYGGPIDRLFAAFFPSENTEAGRRSRAYILEMRRRLAGDAPFPGDA